jgi:hypothetical protein
VRVGRRRRHVGAGAGLEPGAAYGAPEAS